MPIHICMWLFNNNPPGQRAWKQFFEIYKERSKYPITLESDLWTRTICMNRMQKCDVFNFEMSQKLTKYIHSKSLIIVTMHSWHFYIAVDDDDVKYTCIYNNNDDILFIGYYCMFFLLL